MFGRLLLLAVVCAAAFAQSGATIEGRVVGMSGAAVRRAMVQVKAATNGPVSGVETDGEGRFAIRGVQGNSASLSVIRSGYETTQQTVSIPAGQSSVNVTITMSRFGVVYGKVVDEYGDPFGRAMVTIYRRMYENGWRWQQANSVSAGPDGNYSFGDLREGRYIIGAVDNASPNTPGQTTRYVQTYYSGSREISGATAIQVGPEAELRGIDIRLQKGQVFRVRGKVALIEGMQSTSVMLVPHDTGVMTGNRQLGPVNMKDGTFTIERVAEGSYYAQVQMTLRPSGAGAQPAMMRGRESVTVSGRDVDNVVIQLAAGVEITGQVRIDGTVTPPAGANPATAQPRIMLRQMDPNANGGSSTALASADGKFALKNLAQGTFLVSAMGPVGTYTSSIRYDGEDATGIPITVGKSGGTLEVVLRTDGAKLTGVVRDEKGDPMNTETRVTIWSGSARSNYVSATTTDRMGNFNFQNVPPGEYRVVAWDRKMTAMQTYANLVTAPEFYRQFDSTADTVRLQASGQQTQDVKVISEMAMETAMSRLP